jgi:thiol-disulfide isomerase/thioredoxin
MKFEMKLAAVAASLVFAACSGADTPKIDAPAVKDISANQVQVATKTKAVLIYADWCGSCKVLDPKIQKVQAMGDMPGLEFVTLDYTDKNADDFYAQAKMAGVEEAVRAYLDGTIKTGQLLLVDMDDQKVLSKVTKTFDTSQMVSALQDAISAS